MQTNDQSSRPNIENSSLNSTWIPRNKFRKRQLKLRKQKINVIFNYSKVTLTKPMENVLNRGLNFCILPLKLDITQVLVDFRRFKRTMIWREFWHGREQQEDLKPNIFNPKKYNFPKKYQSPKELKVFLSSVKSELMDPKNRNKSSPNLPPEELLALKELTPVQCQVMLCEDGCHLLAHQVTM